jgi:membrane protein
MTAILELLKEAIIRWFEEGAENMAAAVSYYAMFAIAPLIFVSLYVVSLLYGEKLATEVLVAWGSGIVPEIVPLLSEAVVNMSHSPVVTGVSITSLLFLTLAVIIFFNSLTSGINQIWGLPHGGMSVLWRKTLRSLICVGILQVFIIVLIATEFFFTLILDGSMFKVYGLASIYLMSLSVLFTILYSFLPLGVVPSLESRMYGAFVASLCFVLAKTAVAIHIALMPVPGFFGAAGLILVILLWVYVSTSFIYFGAAFAYVHHQKMLRLKAGE